MSHIPCRTMACPSADVVLAGSPFTLYEPPICMIVAAIAARVREGHNYLRYGIQNWWDPTTYKALESWASGCTTHTITLAAGYKFLTISWARKF